MSCQITVTELDTDAADKEGQEAVEADDRHVTQLYLVQLYQILVNLHFHHETTPIQNNL